MADLTSEFAYLVGIMVPALWCRPEALWSDEASYTQAGPLPGVPEPQQDTELVLEATGDQAAGKQLRVQISRAGNPARESGAGLVWKYEPDAYWRGWDPPRLITDWEALEYSSASPYIRQTHAATNPATGTAVVAYQKTVSGIRRVYVRRHAEGAATWSAESLVYTAPSTATQGLHPCLAVSSAGYFYLYHWVELSDSAEMQVRVYCSTDDGVSWTVASRYALDQAVDISGSPGAGASGYDIDRFRVAFAGGQALLMASVQAHDTSATATRAVHQQFASTDGLRFRRIEVGDTASASSGAGPFGFPEVLGLGSVFLVLYLQDAGEIRQRSLESAYQAWSAVSDQAVENVFSHAGWDATNKIFTGGDLAACVDTDGTLYVLSRDFTAGSPTGNAGILRSVDDGATWAGMGDSSLTSGANDYGPWFFGDSSCYPVQFSVAPLEGQLVVPHRWMSSPGAYGESLAMAYLGGFATVTMPGQQAFDLDTKRVGWEVTWLPYELPQDLGWTLTASGTYTLTLESPGRANITTTSGTGQVVFSRSPFGTVDEGVIAEVDVTVNNGGTLASGAVGVRLGLADGVDDYDVTVRLSTTGFRVWDNNAGAQIGSDVSVDTTGGIHLLVGMADDKFSIWYRLGGRSSDRAWAPGPSGPTVSNTASPAPGNQVRFGHLVASTAESWWRAVKFVTDQYTGPIGLAAGQSNPDDLFPRALASEPVYLDGGTRIRATSGPGKRGDTFNVDTRYEYEIERVFPSVEPSPRRAWRSTSDAVEQKIPLVFSNTLLGSTGQESDPGGDLFCLYLGGINWDAGKIQGYTGGGWVTIGTFNASGALSGLGWAREGASIVPAVGGTAFPFLHANEFAGGRFKLGSVVRKIRWHGDGVFSAATSQYQTPRLLLDGVLISDPVSGASGAIWPHQCSVLFSVAGARYSAFRVIADAQTTLEGYHEIGVMALGAVTVTAPLPAQGTRRSRTTGGQVIEAQDRTARARLYAPSARILELPWSDVAFEGAVQGEAPTPDYIRAYTGTGGEPVASWGAAHRTLDGIISMLDDAHVPVVALTKIPVSNDQVRVLNRMDEYLYGWIDEWRRSVFFGADGSDVLTTGGTLVVREQI